MRTILVGLGLSVGVAASCAGRVDVESDTLQSAGGAGGTPVGGSGGTAGDAATVPTVRETSCGSDHCCVLLDSGIVKCWGNNDKGQLGNSTTVASPTPVQVKGINQGFTSLAAGIGCNCAVTKQGGAQCWGTSESFALGNDSTKTALVPIDVLALDATITAVTTSCGHSCAILQSGGVKCWGGNWRGQLGNGSTVDSELPVDVIGLGAPVIALAAGIQHTCALLSGGVVKCWGDNQFGALGNNSSTNSSLPVETTGLTSGVLALSGGGTHTCAIQPEGSVVCWGWYMPGPLTSANYSPVPKAIEALGTDVVSLSARYHTCSATKQGAVFCWGGAGGLAQTPLLNSAAQVTSGGEHACATLVSGGVKCWGSNNFGQLGDGTQNSSYEPVAVSGL